MNPQRIGRAANLNGRRVAEHAGIDDQRTTRAEWAQSSLNCLGAGAEAVEAALRPLCAGGSLVINARVLGDPAPVEVRGPSYALRVHGADRSGIVATITAVVARHGANIVDLCTRLVDGLYVLMAELELPRD